MPYTFGAVNTDDINWATTVSTGGDNTARFVCGWWLPTTLTAGNVLWSLGTVAKAAIDLTDTDELVIASDWTTDGEWGTVGVNMAVDQWSFIAFMSTHENTGDGNAHRCWAGNVLTAPVEVSLNLSVAAAGTPAGSTAFTLGNLGSAGSVAWEGDIAQVRGIFTNAAYGATTHPLGLGTSGAISDDEAEKVYRRLVLPAWEGKPWTLPPIVVASTEVNYWEGDLLGRVVRRLVHTAAVDADLQPTVNGATWSQNRCPRGNVQYPYHFEKVS